jgi:HlyD family secretion protein
MIMVRLRRWRRWRWVVGSGVLLLVWVWWMRAPVVGITTAMVDRGPLRVTIEEVGTTRARDRVEVSAPITGEWIPDVREVGDVVPAGRRLGTLYPAPLDPAVLAEAEARVKMTDALVREGEAQIDAARTAAAEAERTATRTRRLGEAGALSPESVERARDAAVQARQSLAAAEARGRAAIFQLNGARAVLHRGRVAALPVRTPVAGVLLSRAEPQRRVLAAGTLLAEIGNLGDLEVLIPVLTTDVPRIREGAAVDLRLASEPIVAGGADPYPDSAGALTGRVVRIEPTAFPKLSALGVEEQRVHVVVAMPMTGRNALRLGHQFRLQASITAWEAADVVRIPVSALVREGAEWATWVVRDGRAWRRVIRVGERNDAFAQVVGGLATGVQVVTYPGESIREGARVRAERPAHAR